MARKKTKTKTPAGLTPAEQRKRFDAFARQLDKKILPTEEQLEWRPIKKLMHQLSL